MKVKKLVIKNIGMIKDETIELNKPLILFYGEIRQGKTTILNCVRWVMGGTFPEDVIRHGEKEGNILLELDNGSVAREFYKSKDGSTNARPISFVRDGKPVKKPVDEIKKVLNPFLLDQDYLRKMTETERKAYFVELFGVDTIEIDQQYTKAESEARDLRAKIKGYGIIDITKVIPVDIEILRTKRAEILAAHNKELDKIRNELMTVKQTHEKMVIVVDNENLTIRHSNSECEKKQLLISHINERLNKIEEIILEFNEEKSSLSIQKINLNQWLIANPTKNEKSYPKSPDTIAIENRLIAQANTTIIDTQIAEAAANQVHYEQYQKNLKRAEMKAIDEKTVSELEARQRELKKEKGAKLSKIGETSGIKTLSFDEIGNFIYEETSAGMLSGSQIMKLSEELSNLYPKDLGIGLIDRAESLGKSVFLLIDRAKEEEKIILATVVGEKPAEIPEEVGVWIVENGGLKS